MVLNASTFYYVYKNKQSLALVTDTEGSELPQYLVDTSDEQAWGLDVDAHVEGRPITSRCSPTPSSSTRRTRTR